MSTVIPLNGLQCMMLRWEEFHAMNAIHVLHLGTTYNPAFVQQVISERCQSLGLAPVEFINNRRSIRFADEMQAGEVPPPFQYQMRSGPAEWALQGILTDELNTPFEEGMHWPFRFFLIETEQGQFLVLNYQHAISDSRGISLILREIIRALAGIPPAVASLDRNPPPLKKLFPAKSSIRGMLRRGADFFAEITESVSCYHHPRRFSGSLAAESAIHSNGLSTAILKQTTQRLGVKVQDLLFASLLEALSLNFAEQLRTSSRKTIGVYAPADLRRDSTLNTDTAIGQLLGCINVREFMGEQRTFRDLAKSISIRTTRLKESKTYREHSLHMDVMSRIWDRLPKRANRVAGPYLIPLSGYISNVNLTDFLAEEITSGLIQNYFRFSGTGILTPMMFGMTTLGKTFNLTSTHHLNVFSSRDMARIMAQIQMRLSGDIDSLPSQNRFLNGREIVADTPMERIPQSIAS